MFKDNPLLAQLKEQIRETIPTIEGTVKATEKGYGFLQIDSKTSYFIAPPDMRKLMHGDKISAALRENNGKQSAEPEKLVEGAVSRFIAQVEFKDKRTKLRVDHPLINQLISARVKKNAGFSIKEHDWVVAELRQHALEKGHFNAEITDFIAHSDDPFARWKATTAQHQLAWNEPDDQFEFSDQSEQSRSDLSDKVFFTIDGQSTLDMDDAICVEKTENGWNLLVAIADPSAYITPEHPLEQEAQTRAFTLYLPARTVPMMPSALANELCSLKQQQQKLALVCHMSVSDSGELGNDYRFELATIESKHRLSYDEVSNYLEQGKGEFSPALSEALKQLNTLSEQRYSWRAENTTVFGDQADYEFDLDQQGRVIDIHRKPRRAANRMVEESMVAANVIAGRFLARQLGFGVFSAHAGFKQDKLDQVVEALNHFEYSYSKEQLSTLEGFCQLRREIASRGPAKLDGLLKRFYTFSEYADLPLPHFGLGEELYATWTSPIRKYSDLLNHRLIKAVLAEQQPDNPLNDSLTAHLGEARKKHKFAERDMADYLYCQYFNEQDREQTLEAVITSVTRGGLKVRLVESGASAFIAKQALCKKEDKPEFNSELGFFANGEVRYELQQSLQVKVASVNVQNKAIAVKPVTD